MSDVVCNFSNFGGANAKGGFLPIVAAHEHISSAFAHNFLFDCIQLCPGLAESDFRFFLLLNEIVESGLNVIDEKLLFQVFEWVVSSNTSVQFMNHVIPFTVLTKFEVLFGA